MTVDLAELRALAEAATPGPTLPLSYSFETLDEMIAEWSQALRNRPESLTTHAVWQVGTDLFVATTGNGPTSAANAAYIAAANPTTMLALIAEIERLAVAAGEDVARAEAFAKSLHAEHCSKRARADEAGEDDLEPDGLVIDANGKRRSCEVCGEPATRIAGGDEMLPVCDVCIELGEDPEDVVPCLDCGLVDCSCADAADGANEEANHV